MGCALAFSVQITCIDRLAGNLDGLRMNCIQALVVTVLSLPFILLTKESVSFSAIAALLVSPGLFRRSVHGRRLHAANRRSEGPGADHGVADHEPGIRFCRSGRLADSPIKP